MKATISQKTPIIFNIKSGVTPEYLGHLVPPTIQSTTIYPLWNVDHLIIPFCRLSITNSSCFSFNSKTMEQTWHCNKKIRFIIKNELRLNNQSNKISVAKLYYYGPRNINVILTQLGCTASFLNHDVYKVTTLSIPACT
jgi:hypothetical protein